MDIRNTASVGAWDKVRAAVYTTLDVYLHKRRIFSKYVCQGNLLKRGV